MSAATQQRLDAAIQEHVADETGGDLVLVWALSAGIVDQGTGAKTTWLSTSHAARYEVRGLLGDALVMLDRGEG